MVATLPDIDSAARLLEQGQLVAFPTETVYGLGADAENPAAIARIYAAKGRPSNHPVIVHLAPDADLAYWVSAIPAQASALIDRFWPGPLTLILPRAAHIPAAVAGGQASIGVRCPSHPVAQSLLRAFRQGRGGIAAPSANKFGHVSPTTAQHVRDEFGVTATTLAAKRATMHATTAATAATVVDTAIAAILDGGQSEVGIESSILDLSRLNTHGPVLLRPGRITAQQMAEVLGVMPATPVAHDPMTPRASGTLDAHYAPRTPLAMVSSDALEHWLQRLDQAQRRVALLHWSDQPALPLTLSLQLLATSEGYAHALYAGLRLMDGAAADVIVVEQPPHTAGWQAIHDRLRRAACDSVGILERLL